MIIQNRSKSGYFLIRACSRRVFPEESRRRKLIMSGVALAATAAVLLLTLLPLDGIISLPARGVQNLKALFLSSPEPETTVALPQTSTPTVKAQLAPSEFSKPSPPAKALDPVEEEQPVMPPENEKTEEPATAKEVPVTVAETVIPDPQPVTSQPVTSQPATVPAAAYSSILGQLTLRRDETLSRIIQKVYGNFNSKYFKSFILANPDIEDPDRVEVGQIISLPAIHVEVTHLDRPLWWVKFDETDQLEDAYNVLRNYPENASAMRLIPYWTPGDGTQFSVVLNKLFNTEQTARDELALMPARLLSRSEVVSSWDRKSVYFADPYFGRKH